MNSCATRTDIFVVCEYLMSVRQFLPSEQCWDGALNILVNDLGCDFSDALIVMERVVRIVWPFSPIDVDRYEAWSMYQVDESPM